MKYIRQSQLYLAQEPSSTDAFSVYDFSILPHSHRVCYILHQKQDGLVMGNFPVQRQFSSWYSSVFKLLSELTARALWFNWIILHPRWHGLKKVTFVPFGIVAQAGIYSFVPHGHSRSRSAEHWPYIWLLLKGCSSTEVFGDACNRVTNGDNDHSLVTNLRLGIQVVLTSNWS